ncbi:MAG: ABC transporter substrate-binding protein [Deltaproteobacteria bacterium]|nr:ABC transporter substrate-binding protein [Deltaproteobacteria bacterium]
MALILALLSLGAAAPAGAAAQRLLIANSAISGTQMELYVIQDAGIFQKHGLDVQVIFTEGGSRTVQALIAGDIPLASVGGSAVVRSAMAGSGLKIFAGVINTMPYTVAAVKEITRMDQLRGRRVAVSRFGSSSDFSIRFALLKAGLTPDKDVAVVQIGSEPARFAALQNRSAFATVITPPLTLQARKLGLNLLADLSDLGLEYQHTTMSALDTYLVKQADLVRRFLRAWVEGVHFYKTNKEPSLRSIARVYRTTDMEGIEEQYSKIVLKMLMKKPYPTLKGIQLILDEIAEKDPRARHARPEQFVEDRFVRELDQSGFIDQLYR